MLYGTVSSNKKPPETVYEQVNNLHKQQQTFEWRLLYIKNE